ncbi:MAG: riboflavin biosynthesis protein RibD [Bacteroidota bacterium]
MKIHEKYLSRALQIAQLGLGSTAPNPMVGCVIVRDNLIIGEGFTSPYGGAHAEVNAIKSVRQPQLLKSSTLYVTLEPCCHYGKTPPCTNLILDSGIPNVVIGIKDPNPSVAGKGIDQLESAGCTVITGVLEEACMHHHRRFLTFHSKKRPYIILKWAQSLDGFIAPSQGHRGAAQAPYWISNEQSQQLVHRWRTEEAAILVGTGTVHADNPKLNSRLWAGNNPVRVILDRNCSIPANYNVMDNRTLTHIICSESFPPQKIDNTCYHPLDFGPGFIDRLCRLMYELQILSVMVEGGSETLHSFITSEMWDEARIFTGNVPLYSGLSAPEIAGKRYKETQIGNNILRICQRD